MSDAILVELMVADGIRKANQRVRVDDGSGNGKVGLRGGREEQERLDGGMFLIGGRYGGDAEEVC
jgi:hypothetical protein